MHGATGAEWEIWRVGYPLGEQTGRVGALDRLRSGLGGRQGLCTRGTCGRLKPCTCEFHVNFNLGRWNRTEARGGGAAGKTVQNA